jgi:lysozyme
LAANFPIHYREANNCPVVRGTVPIRSVNDLIELHEGRRAKPYLDTVGNVTIGVGRNLTATGLSQSEINILKQNDIDVARGALASFVWFQRMDEVRRAAIIDMVFNIGIGGIMEFKDMQVALLKRDYKTAAACGLQSKWAAERSDRALRDMSILETGEWPTE